MPAILSLPLEAVRTDGGTQLRARIDPGVVREYAAAMQDGAIFPPLTVFQEHPDSPDYCLADGFHRLAACREAGLTEISVEVHAGTRRDAVLHAAGANAQHGLRRTNADKRRSVTALLQDEECRQWSNREIARHCGVDRELVSRVRSELSGGIRQIARLVQRNGVTYCQNTANIGAPGKNAALAAPDAPGRPVPAAGPGGSGTPTLSHEEPAPEAALEPEVPSLLAALPLFEDPEERAVLTQPEPEEQRESALRGACGEVETREEAAVSPQETSEQGPIFAVPRPSGAVRPRQSEAEEIDRLLGSAPAPVEAVPSRRWWRLGNHRIYGGDPAHREFCSQRPPATLAFTDLRAGCPGSAPSAGSRHPWLQAGEGAVALALPNEALVPCASQFPAASQRVVACVWETGAEGEEGEEGEAKAAEGWFPLALFSKIPLPASPDLLWLPRAGRTALPLGEGSTPGEERGEAQGQRTPAALLWWLLERFSRVGDVVIDPFLGAGVTLFAAERLGRTCWGAVADPHACAVLIGRWETMTGEKAVPGPVVTHPFC
jgi:hypothetical protein